MNERPSTKGSEAAQETSTSATLRERLKHIIPWTFFLFTPFLLLFAYTELITGLNTLYREGISGDPNAPEKLWTHLKNIAVPNSTLLNVQSGLVFALLGLSFIEGTTSSPSAPVKKDQFGREWLAHQKKTAKLLSDETALQAIVLIISAAITAVSTLNFIKRFPSDAGGWESSLLAAALFWMLYWIVLKYIIRKSEASPSPSGRVLRLLDTAAALEDLRALSTGESGMTMWRMARGRTRPELPEDLQKALEQDTEPKVIARPARFKGLLASVLRRRSELWAISVGLLIPLIVVTMMICLDKNTPAEAVLRHLVAAAGFSMILTLCFSYSVVMLHQAVLERLSQKEFVSTYLLAWIMFIMSIALLTTIWSSELTILYARDIESIRVALFLFCLFSLPALLKWGHIIARPLAAPDKSPFKEIIDHVSEELKAEKTELLTEIREAHRRQTTTRKYESAGD